MSQGSTTKIGHGLAKVLGIKINYRSEGGTKEDISRGESAYSISSADTYVEEEPTAAEWLREITPTPRGLLLYAYNLFPFVHWIGRYNVQWLFGDLVAGKAQGNEHCTKLTLTFFFIGITVGAVVVPQSMAYAALANLAPQFGLYSSFMGVLIYWFFATSKDITIGVSFKLWRLAKGP